MSVSVCAVGYGSNVTACNACDIGKYKDTVGNTACTACPIGLSTASTGSTASTACSGRSIFF